MAYGALIGGRASMIKDSSDVLKMALIIAIRYAAVRRQGQPFREGQPEPKLLDFKTHQCVAQCGVMWCDSTQCGVMRRGVA